MKKFVKLVLPIVLILAVVLSFGACSSGKEDTAEMPEYDEATQYITVKYTDTPEKIIKEYTVYDIEIPEEIENV